MAAQEVHFEIVQLLVKRGANIHQANHQGMNPLHSATFNQRADVVDYLIKKGANYDDQGNAVASVGRILLRVVGGRGSVHYPFGS